jgi:hypothetical protein
MSIYPLKVHRLHETMQYVHLCLHLCLLLSPMSTLSLGLHIPFCEGSFRPKLIITSTGLSRAQRQQIYRL